MSIKTLTVVAIAMFGGACAAQAVQPVVKPLQNDGVSLFVAHPTHCAVILGGQGYENEGASVEYSNALSAALDVLQSKTNDVIKAQNSLVSQCASKPSLAQAKG